MFENKNSYMDSEKFKIEIEESTYKMLKGIEDYKECDTDEAIRDMVLMYESELLISESRELQEMVTEVINTGDK